MCWPVDCAGTCTVSVNEGNREIALATLQHLWQRVVIRTTRVVNNCVDATDKEEGGKE